MAYHMGKPLAEERDNESQDISHPKVLNPDEEESVSFPPPAWFSSVYRYVVVFPLATTSLSGYVAAPSSLGSDSAFRIFPGISVSGSGQASSGEDGRMSCTVRVKHQHGVLCSTNVGVVNEPSGRQFDILTVARAACVTSAPHPSASGVGR